VILFRFLMYVYLFISYAGFLLATESLLVFSYMSTVHPDGAVRIELYRLRGLHDRAASEGSHKSTCIKEPFIVCSEQLISGSDAGNQLDF